MPTETTPTQEQLLDDSYRDAMQRAGHLLASRPRTEHELRIRLGAAGYHDPVVERVVIRLIELRLVDDRGFAAQWVSERAISKGRSGEALIAELVDKGIERATAEDAVAEAGIDEEIQARELAARLVSKVANKPLEKQAEALLGRLLRRGFSHEVARDAVRSVLPPEGWD
ncbi:MAG: regulatory protein [Actinomycetota bacterium]|jgi:regulatory protein|nr:regulatory protein [Actinomycetota bacterium]